MSSDCEHLIRHMLVVEPDKRLSLAQIQSHRWMAGAPPPPAPDPLSQLEPEPDLELVEWVARELQTEPQLVLESVRARAFDHNYALYHLARDASHVAASPASAPPSPPLLPVVPSSVQRKSSITTGVVEREPPQAKSLQAPSPLRRHTFGPDAASGQSSSTAQLVTPPLLFLTPPQAPPPLGNLPLAPPNYPLHVGPGCHMDLLRPPNVLLMVNNNMGRRASDGQADYGRLDRPERPDQPPDPRPAASRARAKRHSLTNTDELVQRQRRSSAQSPSQDRSVFKGSFPLLTPPYAPPGLGGAPPTARARAT